MEQAHLSMPGRATRRSDVELRLPADNAYVSVLRTVASGLAARLDFTIEDIEDLRMAISEACALMLPMADHGSDLHAEFFLDEATITASVRVSTEHPTTIDQGAWAWQVLNALTAEATQSVSLGHVTLTLTMHSAVDV
ncbi:anti-sigma factor [Nocardioides sp.]|uniref:anti-sigma factor n=1 Tax=Nocardioides sp. TaxID=35761 RepID=UPI003D111C48